MLGDAKDIGADDEAMTAGAAADHDGDTSSTERAELVIGKVFDESLEEDIDWLESKYQDIYRNSISPDDTAQVLHLELWTQLGSKSVVGELAGKVFRHFRRLSLLNVIMPADSTKKDGKETSAAGLLLIESFNNALKLVWAAMGTILQSYLSDEQHSLVSSLGPNVLYGYVSPNSDVSTKSLDVMFKFAGTKSLRSGMECLIKKDSEAFWQVYSDVLDIFRDHSTLGPPLLNSALKVLSVMTEIVAIVFNGSEYFNVNKSELWIKSWPFIDALLASSVKWAKQDLTLKHSVKETIRKTFELSESLLGHRYVIIDGPRGPASANVPLSKAIASSTQWFKVLAEELRSASASTVMLMLETALEFNLKLDSFLLETLFNYAAGSLKSHLSEAEKSILLSFVNSIYTNLGIPKPQLPSVSKDVMMKDAAPPKQPGTIMKNAVPAPAPIPTVPKVSGFSFANAAPVRRPGPINTFSKLTTTAAPKPKAGTSKMAQLRQEHYLDSRRINAVKKSVTVRSVSPEEEEGRSGFKALLDEDSPERPKRTIVMLDEHNNVIDNLKKRKVEVVRKIIKPPPAPLRTVNDLFRFLLSWDIESTGDTPPDFKGKSRDIPESFGSLEEYTETFEPLLFLECWEQFKQAKENADFSQRAVLQVQSSMMLDDFSDVTFCQSVTEVKSVGLSENDLVLLELKSKTKCSVIALIRSVQFKKNDAYVVARFLLSKAKHEVVQGFHPNAEWSLVRLFSITTSLREYVSLIGLPQFPLYSEILNPVGTDPSPVSDAELRRTIKVFGVNEPQASAIIQASTQTSGFTLIQGPPGTGKTKTILSLVGSLLTTAAKVIAIPGSRTQPTIKRGKLMICAPSNAACDEIIRRLKAGIVDARGEPFFPSIVRLGNARADNVSADAKPLILESIVDSLLKEDSMYKRLADGVSSEKWDLMIEQQKNLNIEREALREKEKEQGQSAAEANALQTRMRSLNEKMKRIDEGIQKIKSDRMDKSASVEQIKTRLKNKVINDADIIMSTLSGAGHEVLNNVVGLQFLAVIIDEACQSIELSSLIPLRFNTKKCIMVGDPKQLPPTVLSPAAQRYGYEKSLFQRLMSSLRDRVCLLSIQYRMHPDISSFPSAQFYGSRLEDAVNMATLRTAAWHEDRRFPPFAFFNVEWGREQRAKGHSLYNPDEIIACVNLVHQLCSKFPNIGFASRIGVITPYKMQMTKLREMFKECFGSAVAEAIDINTVDAFQGQEKDIILLSTVRAGLGQPIGFLKDKRRMNVALTRAKHSLFVVGRGTSLQNNDDWRALVEAAQDRSMFIELDRNVYGAALKFGASNLLKKQ